MPICALNARTHALTRHPRPRERPRAVLSLGRGQVHVQTAMASTESPKKMPVGCGSIWPGLEPRKSTGGDAEPTPKVTQPVYEAENDIDVEKRLQVRVLTSPHPCPLPLFFELFFAPNYSGHSTPTCPEQLSLHHALASTPNLLVATAVPICVIRVTGTRCHATNGQAHESHALAMPSVTVSVICVFIANTFWNSRA